MRPLRPVLFLILLVLFLPLGGCGVTASQLDTIVKLDEAKAAEFADISVSFYNLCDAVEKAAPPDSIIRQKMADAKTYINQKNTRFEQLARDSIRAIMASKEIPPEKQQEYMETLFRLIDSIKGKAAAPTG